MWWWCSHRLDLQRSSESFTKCLLGIYIPLDVSCPTSNQCAHKPLHAVPTKLPPTCICCRISKLSNDNLQLPEPGATESFDASFPEFTPPFGHQVPPIQCLQLLRSSYLALPCTALAPNSIIFCLHMGTGCPDGQHLTFIIHPSHQAMGLSTDPGKPLHWVNVYFPVPALPSQFLPHVLLRVCCAQPALIPHGSQGISSTSIPLCLKYPALLVWHSHTPLFFNPENCMPPSNVTLSVFLVPSLASSESKPKQ